jgi:hypothetical protein
MVQDVHIVHSTPSLSEPCLTIRQHSLFLDFPLHPFAQNRRIQLIPRVQKSYSSVVFRSIFLAFFKNWADYAFSPVLRESLSSPYPIHQFHHSLYHSFSPIHPRFILHPVPSRCLSLFQVSYVFSHLLRCELFWYNCFVFPHCTTHS